jgi:hypothetical protein
MKHDNLIRHNYLKWKYIKFNRIANTSQAHIAPYPIPSEENTNTRMKCFVFTAVYL